MATAIKLTFLPSIFVFTHANTGPNMLWALYCDYEYCFRNMVFKTSSIHIPIHTYDRDAAMLPIVHAVALYVCLNIQYVMSQMC
jgi:hypothetical protein